MFKLEFRFSTYTSAMMFADDIQSECREKGSITIERVLKVADGYSPSLRGRFFTYPDIKDYAKKFGWAYDQGGIDLAIGTERMAIHFDAVYVIRVYNLPVELVNNVQEQIDALYKKALKSLVTWDHKDPDVIDKALANLKEIQRLLGKDPKLDNGSLGDAIYKAWKENKK